MAFPQVLGSVTETAFAGDTTAHLVAMPATVSAGELLMMLFVCHTTAAHTKPDGWEVQWNLATSTLSNTTCFVRVADGTEGGTTVDVVTADAQSAAAQVYRITDWEGTLSGVENGTAVSAVSNTPDPPSLTPSWGLLDTLWIAMFGAGDDDETVTSFPTDYTDGVDTVSGAGGDAGCEVGTARRERSIDTEDPDQFTLTASEQNVANTVAIRPQSVTQNLGGSGNSPIFRVKHSPWGYM